MICIKMFKTVAICIRMLKAHSQANDILALLYRLSV